MQCSCGNAEATVHEVIQRNGEIIDRYLCEQCAARAGLTPSSEQPALTELISNYVIATQGKPASKEKPGGDGPTCGGCGLNFDAFRRTGLIGCSSCYDAFEPRLTPLLERAHGGASSHVGKVPRRALAQSRGAGASAPRAAAEVIAARAARIAALRTDLDVAVREERYEDAAKARDELDRLLSNGGRDAGGAGETGETGETGGAS